MATRSPGREEKKGRAGPPVAGYGSSDAHLGEHIRRIGLLVKAQTIRWRATIAETKPDKLWGMIHVTDAEVQAFLASPVENAVEYPAEAAQAIAGILAEADGLSQKIEDNERSTPPATELRLRRVVELFRLSPAERDVLLVCLLPESDARFRRLYGYLQDDASRTQPNVELIASILSRDGGGLAEVRKLFEGDAPLVRNALVVVRQRSEEPMPVRSVRIDDRIAGFLFGQQQPDARLVPFVSEPRPLDPDALLAEAQHVERLRRLAAWWQNPERRGGAAIFLRGPYGSGKLTSARVLATAAGMPLLAMDAKTASRLAPRWDETVQLAFREALLRGAVLYWQGCESLFERDQPAGRLDDLISGAERFDGLAIFGSEHGWDPADRFQTTPFLRVDVPTAGYALRRRFWDAHMPSESEFADPAPALPALAESLASRFQLTEGQILDSIRAARAHAVSQNASDPRLTADDLFDGCRRQSGRRLLSFSRRIEPRTQLKFSDLVLPKTNLRQLREVQSRIRMMQRVQAELGLDQRLRLGKGMVVLFTGSSGTGKSMAAEWLARELGVDLYKADLSAVVSKWVGETEKNLNQLFGEAEDSSAIIFFDEADALFGKRGEVKDARDRWANTEVNFLLQRIEEYSGVVILASNLRQNIDEAFLRRITAMVEFPAPDEEARIKIWLGMFPPALKRPPDEEIRSLAAKVRLPGGSVRNIVLEAAFRAVAEAGDYSPTVTLRHLVAATAREYQKLGKPLTKAELGDLFYSWIEEDIL